MARIPDDQLVRLKQDIAVQRLTEMRGITLKRHAMELLQALDLAHTQPQPHHAPPDFKRGHFKIG